VAISQAHFPAERYTYQPLPSPTSFHILELFPGSKEDSISLRLKTADFGNPLSYEAIFYCWGSPNLRALATCEDKLLEITPSLRDALVRMRLTDKLRLLFTHISLFRLLRAGSGSSAIRSRFMILSHSLARLERIRSNLPCQDEVKSAPGSPSFGVGGRSLYARAARRFTLRPFGEKRVMAKAQQKMTPAKSFLRQDPRLKKIPDACPFQIPRCRSSRCWMKHSCSNFIKSASRMIIASLLDDCAMVTSVKWPRSLLSPFSSPFSLWASGFTPVKIFTTDPLTHYSRCPPSAQVPSLSSSDSPIMSSPTGHPVVSSSSTLDDDARVPGFGTKWEPFEATHTHTHTHTRGRRYTLRC
jgi:hypothetical protein